MRRVLALLLIPAAAIVAAPTIAIVELVSPVEPLTFLATFDEDESCVDGDFEHAIEANEEGSRRSR